MKTKISFEELHTLRVRFSKLKKDSQGWEDAEDFIRWCLKNGYRKGRNLRRKFPSKPHGPTNSYFYDPKERTGICEGCKMKCPTTNMGCLRWRIGFADNWERTRRIFLPEVQTAEPAAAPPVQEKFRYEHPDLEREGITFG